MVEIVKETIGDCDPEEKKIGSWLGLKKTESGFSKRQFNGFKMIEYENWESTPTSIHECGVFHVDGLWESRPRANCPRIRACPVCSFTKVPKLTMKGICHESIIDYYWYLEKSTHYGVYYNGYRGDKIFSKDNYKRWIVKERITNKMNYSIELTGPGFPVGSQLWDVSDPFCDIHSEPKTKIVFSVCRLGMDFPCDSGECIPKFKRCNSMFDCSDHSDETDCKAIIIGETYDNSKFNHPVQNLHHFLLRQASADDRLG